MQTVAGLDSLLEPGERQNLPAREPFVLQSLVALPGLESFVAVANRPAPDREDKEPAEGTPVPGLAIVWARARCLSGYCENHQAADS